MAFPLPQETSRRNPKTFNSMPLRRPPQRRFRRGELVEVSSFEEGFLGSYYEATVVAADHPKQCYVVQYRTLVKDDLSGPLREVVSAAEVRPRPPVVMAATYNMHDVVDAFDNDGWWVGQITGRIRDEYVVYFETTGDKLPYSKDRLRIHQDWKNEQWVYCCNV